jgi:hypothetical protein
LNNTSKAVEIKPKFVRNMAVSKKEVKFLYSHENNYWHLCKYTNENREFLNPPILYYSETKLLIINYEASNVIVIIRFLKLVLQKEWLSVFVPLRKPDQAFLKWQRVLSYCGGNDLK